MNGNGATFQRFFVALATALSYLLLVLTNDSVAQTITDANWHAHADTRLNAIYDRGEFRAKRFQPIWLNDSSGFLIEELDPLTNQSMRWLYDSQSGKRRAWRSDDMLPVAMDKRLLANGKLRIETRMAKLVAVNQEDQSEVLLTSSNAERPVEYRDPVWSPDGSRVLFIEVDRSDVRQRTVLVPGDPSYPDVKKNHFARVGGEIEKLRVGVVNANGSQLRWLPIEFPEEGVYLGLVDWAGNSDEVLVEKFSRFRDKREFLLVNTNGQVKTIFSEKSDTWVEASQGKNSGLAWIRAGKEFVVLSEKDGWRHAYRYSRDGEELAQLTPGDYDLIDRAAIDEDRGWYYFYASPMDGTQKYLYRVPLDGGGESQMVSPKGQIGTHFYSFSPNNQWAIHTFSTLDSPPLHTLVEVERHHKLADLEDNHDIREKMKSLRCQPTEFLKLDIGNDIVFDAWMIKPLDFDATKKYPILVYVYGEPHAQTVLNEWGAAQIDFHRLIAELGYIVVSLDNRGTPAPKGAAWRRAIFGSLGPLSTEEQEAGLKALAKQCSFVDLARVGIWGWSGGGSNTLNALFRKSESYQVGIAVVPKPQPHLYNAWFQEIYMRTREVNAEGYERSAPINFADGLKGKLLIITGSGETNTHIQIIEGLVDRLIALGKSFDYMVYPNRDHGLREGDGTVVHVRKHILRYLKNNLPPGPR